MTWMLALLAPVALAQDTEPEYPDLQVAVHGGLIQPLLARGFNAALDVRHHRFIATYSHGEGLDMSRFALTEAQRDAGAQITMPYTTGFGLGATLVDELWALADFKVHGIEVDSGIDQQRYTTITVGAEVGYRLFVTPGLFVAPVVRYWPNVYASADGTRLAMAGGGTLELDPLAQGIGGLFANVLVGGAFDIRGKRRTGLAKPRP